MDMNQETKVTVIDDRLENQGLRPLPENVAIILDFFRNVKMKSEQIIDKLYNKNVD